MKRSIRLLRFMLALRAAMRAYPSQRIGQLVMNAATYGGKPSTADCFYTQDDDLAARLRAYAADEPLLRAATP